MMLAYLPAHYAPGEPSVCGGAAVLDVATDDGCPPVVELVFPCPEVAPLDIIVFNKYASPLTCGDCSRDTFISRLKIVPLEVDPRSTAGGCG